jgi:hypothetical protein
MSIQLKYPKIFSTCITRIYIIILTLRTRNNIDYVQLLYPYISIVITYLGYSFFMKACKKLIRKIYTFPIHTRTRTHTTHTTHTHVHTHTCIIGLQ